MSETYESILASLAAPIDLKKSVLYQRFDRTDEVMASAAEGGRGSLQNIVIGFMGKGFREYAEKQLNCAGRDALMACSAISSNPGDERWREAEPFIEKCGGIDAAVSIAGEYLDDIDRFQDIEAVTLHAAFELIAGNHNDACLLLFHALKLEANGYSFADDGCTSTLWGTIASTVDFKSWLRNSTDISIPASAGCASNSAPQKPSGGCYVATCVYGSYDCPEVWTLRRFRDYGLAASWCGRAFVKAYYAISPKLVEWFGDADWFKDMWRGRLNKLVSRCRRKGYEDTPYDDCVR